MVKVRLWGMDVGYLSWDKKAEVAVFEYEPSFLESGLDIAPLTMAIGSSRSQNQLPWTGDKDKLLSGTSATVRRISLNPDPKDKVSNEQFTEMAQEYKDFFEFIPQEHSANFDLGLFSLLPDAQGVDYEEEQFAKRMKKKKKKGRRL